MLQSGIRTLHGITWTDDLAWMESMKGKAWTDLIHKKQEKWSEKTNSLEEEANIFASEIHAANEVSTIPLFQARGSNKEEDWIQISRGGTTFLQWCWREKKETVFSAADLDTCRKYPGMVWVIEEVKAAGGAEVYQLACYIKEKKDPVWIIQAADSFAPSVAVVEGRVYVLEGENRLMYKTLVSFNALTGKGREIHYVETKDMYNLQLVRCSCEGAYLIRSTGPKQDLLWIDGGAKGGVHVVAGIELESRRFVLSDVPFAYWMWTAQSGWQSSPKLREMIKVPKLSLHDTIESVSCNKGLLITRDKGERTIWRVKHTATMIWKGLGNVTLDDWDGCWVRITQPGCEAIWWNTERDAAPVSSISLTHTVEVIDLKKSPLRAVIVRQTKEAIRGLLVVGYGAYGIPTGMNTSRWQPLLHRGWAVCFGLWRGGGDDSPAWEDAGRLSGRLDVLMDAEAVVRAAQKATGCTPDNTWLYGRSAGGLWVGGLVASRGRDVCSGAYMEVPYLDVLQTTTNPHLPLTLLETDEFGRPAQRLSDLEGILRWSPMELLRADPDKAKEVYQIVRTGLNDKEVYAYESVKWATRCGEKCFLAVENGQGHFVGGHTALKQEGMDLAFLLELTQEISEKNRK
jgi:hypothetical protein